jgi:hypothetical protein
MGPQSSGDGLSGFAPASTTNGLNSPGSSADFFRAAAVIADLVATMEVTAIAATRYQRRSM